MTQDSTLTLAADASDARLTSIARDLARDLGRAGIKARPVEQATVPGERGDAVTLGQLALDLVTSGAVTALLECLKAYIAREHTLIVKVKRSDGSEVEISAKNVGDDALVRTFDSSFPPS